MNAFKRLINYMSDTEISLRERNFVLTSLTSAVTLTFIFIWNFCIGEAPLKVIALGVTVLAMYLFTWLWVKLDFVAVGSVINAFMIIFFVLPIEYFTGGGVFGCTPVWFAFAFLYIGLNLHGIACILCLSLLVGSAVTCYVVSYLHPKYLVTHTVGVAYLDSIASVIGVGVLLYITITFMIRIYKREQKTVLEQKEQIDALNKAQNRFFSSMSHEIRTPINTIVGLNEMILREEVSDEVAEDAANIRAASKMLLHLINDILDMSKIESGQMKLTPTAYRPGDMLSDLVGMLWLRAREKGLEFRVDVAPDVPEELLGDEVRINQVLINVINNSIKYTKEGSVTFSIQCERGEGDMATIIYTVTDTGMGIKKESIPHLFTAFKRVDEEKNRYIEGTGLGLSIVKQLVDMMGGRITVNSVYTKGSTFIIEIPQRVLSDTPIGALDTENSHRMRIREEYEHSFEAPEARVLVVDDTAANVLVVTKLLRDTKVQIDTAGSGAEALEKTLENTYQVIFMDHMMPEMDGIECMHGIREQVGGMSREAKIVVLTANAGSENQLLYQKEGFDGYLLKPVSGDALEKELYRQLPRDMIVSLGGDEGILEESVSWIEDHRKRIPVAITTESVADLPKSITDRYHIAVLPHMVETDKGIFKDGLEIDTEGVLSFMAESDMSVQTVAPDVAAHEEFFAEQLVHANNIIHLSISSRVTHSGCIAAQEAAKAFDNVFVFDTHHLSSGQGLMVIEACRMAEEGMSPEEILAALEKLRPRVHTEFIVDDIDYLVRAHQIPPKVGRVSKSLMMHPIISLKKGKMGIGKLQVGSSDHARQRYVESLIRGAKTADRRILFVTYVGMTQKELDRIRTVVMSQVPFDEVYFQKASPAIAANCGPGTFGLLYIDAK
ncbi:MAG: DegV family protein [Eubacterium sp.]|nr:DegV family protein [Eubacterium sp.]